MFTAHYLRVATLFRLLFLRHTDYDLDLVRKRKFWVTLITIIVCVCILCLRLSAIFLYRKLNLLIFCIYNWLGCGFYWIITLVISVSICHIHRSQRPLERIGIFANRWIMRMYLLNWCGFCISETMWCVAATIIDFDIDDDNFNQSRLMYISSIFYWIFYTGIVCIVLSTFLRLSNQVEKEKAAEITQSLTEQSRQKSQHDNLLEDRERF